MIGIDDDGGGNEEVEEEAEEVEGMMVDVGDSSLGQAFFTST